MMTHKRISVSSSMNPVAEWLLTHNQAQSRIFNSPEERAIRAAFRREHPTEFLVFKCMDGRLNLSVLTNIPMGIITPFRNLGGSFDLGWPYLSHAFLSHIEYLAQHNKRAFLIFTYHYSKGKRERGCKGFNYDVENARRAAEEMCTDAKEIVKRSRVTLYPIVIGIETDECGIIFHDKNGDALFTREWMEEPQNEKSMLTALSQLYPDLSEIMLNDLFTLFAGNLAYMKKRETEEESIIELDHKEQILCVGRGFDWLHTPNLALIVGPYGINLEEPIAKAAGILLENLIEKRIPKEQGIVVVAASLFREDILGIEEELAFLKASTLAEFAMDTIHRHVPQLEPYVTLLVGTTDMRNRFFKDRTHECRECS